MPSLGTSKVTLASQVANAGTFTMPYPTGLNQAALLGTTGGRVAVGDNDIYPQAPSGAGTFAFSFGASDITVTNNTGVALPAGSVITASFGRSEQSGRYESGVQITPIPQTLTTSVGTASTTIPDVGGAFTQATLNNINKSFADQINAITAALKKAGITAG